MFENRVYKKTVGTLSCVINRSAALRSRILYTAYSRVEVTLYTACSRVEVTLYTAYSRVLRNLSGF